MKRSGEIYLNSSDTEWEEMGPGISRKIMAWDNQLMTVKVKFDKGAVAGQHNHYHTQASYCASGKFEFTLAGQTYNFSEGDSLYIAPNQMHSVVCTEAGIIIDAFSPVREDFLSEEVPPYLGD